MLTDVDFEPATRTRIPEAETPAAIAATAPGQLRVIKNGALLATPFLLAWSAIFLLLGSVLVLRPEAGRGVSSDRSALVREGGANAPQALARPV